MAYSYDNLRLEKGMYGEAGKSFTQVLEAADPSENYKGTPLEGLDAFQRQLKRFDIHVKGSRSDVVETRMDESMDVFEMSVRTGNAVTDVIVNDKYLNGEFLQRLIDAGAPEAMFEEFAVDLTADDGLKQYGTDSARIGLITCDEYRALRENIPPLPNDWWWTATPDSPINNFVRDVSTDGTLSYYNACYGYFGVRPLCVLQSEILKSYLDGGAKQRAEAVDMMKHIAAAWNVKPEEVFGKDGAGNDNV